MVMYKLGDFLGWLTILLFAGTIANYVVKFISKKWGRKISASPVAQKPMSILMKVFVKNHRYFGFGAFLALLLHFILQLINFGFSISGIIAAALLIVQVMFGMYATLKKKPRKGTWFIAHRTIAVLLILGIAFHLMIRSVVPTAPSLPVPAPSTSAVAEKIFTLKELSNYNGQNGQPAYVAYKGIVYDVSNAAQWTGGTHHGEQAGTDVTNDISKSPHGEKVFADLPRIGTLQN